MKLAILLANGFEESEALITVDILKRADMAIDMVTINDDLKVTGSHDVTILANSTLNDTNINQYDGLILPGGMPGVTNLENNQTVIDAINNFADEGKYLFAICAAPSILVKQGLLDDHYYTCYPGFEVADSTAIYTNEKVVVDKNIITAKAMGATTEFALAIVNKLYGFDTYKKVKDQIYY